MCDIRLFQSARMDYDTAVLIWKAPYNDERFLNNAAKSALHSCGKVVLEGHIQHCIRDGIESGNIDETLDDLTVAVERFANMK